MTGKMFNIVYLIVLYRVPCVGSGFETQYSIVHRSRSRRSSKKTLLRVGAAIKRRNW